MNMPLWPRPTNTAACYDDGLEVVEHVDGFSDEEAVFNFLAEYTEVNGEDEGQAHTATTDWWVYVWFDLPGTGTGAGFSSAGVTIKVKAPGATAWKDLVTDVWDVDFTESGDLREFRARAFIPRDTQFRIVITSEFEVLNMSRFIAHIIGSKT